MSPELKNSLIRSGTLHIIALSGMNISLVAGMVATTLSRIFSKRQVAVITAFSIIGYVWLVGFGASVVRAALMGLLVMGSVLIGKKSIPLWGWVVTVIIMLAVKPEWVRDMGFLLSSLATLGILLFGNQAVRTVYVQSTTLQYLWAKRIRELAIDNLRVSLAAQVFTWPLLLFVFGRISLIGPIANLLIGWTIFYITVGGFVLLLVGGLFSPLGILAAAPIWLLLEYLLKIVDLTAQIPGGSWQFW